MSVNSLSLETVQRNLNKVRQDLWKADIPEVGLEAILKELLSLKAQVAVQKTLQATATLLREHPSTKALPKQQATKVRHFIRFVFRRDSGEGSRQKQLRAFDCDTLKFLGLSYSTQDIIKMDATEFGVLLEYGSGFLDHCNISCLLYRPDVDKAVDAEFKNADQNGSYDEFLQGTRYGTLK